LIQLGKTRYHVSLRQRLVLPNFDRPMAFFIDRPIVEIDVTFFELATRCADLLKGMVQVH